MEVLTAGSISCSPAVANGVVYVASWDQKFYALNYETGQKLWSGIIGSVDSPSSPAVSEGKVYIGSSNR